MLREYVALSEKAQGRPMPVPADLSSQPAAKATSTGVETTVGSL